MARRRRQRHATHRPETRRVNEDESGRFTHPDRDQPRGRVPGDALGFATDRYAAPGSVSKNQDPAALGVKSAVAHVMKHVVGIPQQRAAQFTKRGRGQFGEGQVPGIDAAAFEKFANDAKAGCPVSKALASVPKITLTTKFKA